MEKEAAGLPVCQGGDDQTRRVSKILVRVNELSITDVNEAVTLLLRPGMSELGEPLEGLGGGDL